MKKFEWIKVASYFVLAIMMVISSVSCNKDKFLKEIPKNFYSTANAYETKGDMDIALNGLYAEVRQTLFGGGDLTNNFAYFLATDIAFDARQDNNLSYFGRYNISVTPTSTMVTYHWRQWYKIVSDANFIISNLTENSKISDRDKTEIEAEARFFRAFAFRHLVYLYGDVPIYKEAITSPKVDFKRANKDDVLRFIADDLEFASKNLPSIAEVKDGKVSDLVAYHYLAETYISLKMYQEAINAASEVIDNPNVSLMTERFGTRASEPGDVYWDLFRRGNQNRASGNRESLWVAQMEVDVPGGFLSSTSRAANLLERYANPVAFLTFIDPDGKEGMTGLQYSDYNIGGRGASFMQNTDYVLYDIWENDWDDMRNSSFNIVRDIKYNNPASRWFDSSAVKYPSPTWQNQHWRWYPWLVKTTTPGNHPDNAYIDKSQQILSANIGSTYRDMYILRLPMTLLLRAEAYLDNANPEKAVEDINKVRQRANAPLVTSSDVTLDYILDERARELTYEEPRRIILCRLGNLVERVKKYNEWNSTDIQDFNILWPIPLSDIEANTGEPISQNLGY